MAANVDLNYASCHGSLHDFTCKLTVHDDLVFATQHKNATSAKQTRTNQPPLATDDRRTKTVCLGGRNWCRTVAAQQLCWCLCLLAQHKVEVAGCFLHQLLRGFCSCPWGTDAQNWELSLDNKTGSAGSSLIATVSTENPPLALCRPNTWHGHVFPNFNSPLLIAGGSGLIPEHVCKQLFRLERYFWAQISAKAFPMLTFVYVPQKYVECSVSSCWDKCRQETPPERR